MWLTVCRYFRTSATLGRGHFAYYNKFKPIKGPDRQDPDYFEKKAASLPLDEHYIDNLKMLWEEKIGNERELHLKAADSLIGREEGDYGLTKITPLRPKIEYENIPELKNASEEVQKLFSIEFGERSDYTEACKKDLIDLVKTHHYDENSLQIKIAWSTVMIRHLIELIDSIKKREQRKPRQLYEKLYNIIGFRLRTLRLLREQDYEEFQKILETLKISYRVEKPPEHVKTRKAWSLFSLQKRVDAEKERMMDNLKLEFDKDKEVRLNELNAKLEDLNRQQREVEDELRKCAIIEDRLPQHVDGTYKPKLVEEMTEIYNHNMLFYKPAPRKKAA